MPVAADEEHKMRLFCYGTLQYPEIMEQVSGNHYPGMPVVLENYGCYTLRGEVFPGIVPEEGAQTRGVLYNALGNAQLERLDAFESDYYMRRRVVVSDADDRPLQAWAYVLRPEARERLTDEVWDRNRFEALHLQQFLRRLSG
ncbi:MAG: gamma-glutamylcyclotransferase family protein [Pseudomonadota bacterium]